MRAKPTPLWLPILAAIASVGAGIYLLLTRAVASDSIFNPLLHGIGVYFIARGFYMGWSAARKTEELDVLKMIAVELHQGRGDTEMRPPAQGGRPQK